MEVRGESGSLRRAGLINKPGMAQDEYHNLFKSIHAANPAIQIEPDITS